MRTVFSYLVLLVLLLVYIISSTNETMKEIAAYKYTTKSIWASDKYRYGDLYGMCNLPEFKFEFKTDSLEVNMPDLTQDKFINLYAIHDSYMADGFVKSTDMFHNVNQYINSEWLWRNNTPLLINIDTSKTNILLFEIAERHLREYFDTNACFNKIMQLNEAASVNETDLKSGNFTFGFDNIEQTIFNPLINQNLEFNLFDNQLFSSVREFKAQLNYKLFDRVDKQVYVSSDKQYLYLSETVDPSSLSSSFNPITDEEVLEMIYDLNIVYKQYKKMGFSEVYFSIIPNPVTILNSESNLYNNLIPRLQNNSTLEMPVIDIYTVFKNANIPIYYNSDTHWNTTGFNIWLSEFNKVLDSQSNQIGVAGNLGK